MGMPRARGVAFDVAVPVVRLVKGIRNMLSKAFLRTQAAMTSCLRTAPSKIVAYDVI